MVKKLMPLTCKCKDCDKRSVGCHATCSEYADFKKRLADFNENKKKAKLSYHILNCIEDHAVKKENYTARFFRRWREDD